MSRVTFIISASVLLLVLSLAVADVLRVVPVLVAALPLQAQQTRRICYSNRPSWRWGVIPRVPTVSLFISKSTEPSATETSESDTDTDTGTTTVSINNITRSSIRSNSANHHQPTPVISPTPAYGLYEVQEDMLTQRGIYEEQLMSHTTSTPLVHIVPPTKQLPVKRRSTASTAAGGGGGMAAKKGFGASPSVVSPNRAINPYETEATTAAAQHYASILRTDGLVRIDNVIPNDIVDELKEFVMKLRYESTIKQQQQQQSKSRTEESPFADVLLRKNRCDLKIPIGNYNHTSIHTPVIPALYNALCCSPVSGTISSTFRDTTETTELRPNKKQMSDDAVLYELSCLISDYGSNRQVVHPDNPFRCSSSSSLPTLLTCFIALQDITNIDMGPTIFLPKTHTKYAHELFAQDTITTTITNSVVEDQQQKCLSPKDTLLRDTPSVIGTLTKGSCVIYDSRLLHCGSANRMINTNRAIFYFSFRNPKISYPGNPPSIRNDLQQEQITLSNLQKTITKIHNENMPNPFHY